MPLIVNHDHRRKKVIEATCDILARSGLDAVTVRDVAKAAGYSTSVVSHYFRSKEELLYLTFASNVERTTRAGAEALEASGGDLKAYLSAAMPLDEEHFQRWRVWLAYIALVVAKPDIAKQQHASANFQIARITGILDDLVARGDVAPGQDHELIARRLLGAVMGLALQVLFDRPNWPPQRQHRLMDAELRPLYLPGRLPASISAADIVEPVSAARRRAVGSAA